jgi:predicted RNA-binding Zn-ribbon protein involved in translation (DUF1610 family)
MASDRKPIGPDEDDYFLARDARLGAARATTCAACQVPLPEGHRYLCAACVEESARRAQTLLASLQTPAPAAPTGAAAVDQAPDADDYAECPNCGMTLDASGRCAFCVTTVRR